MPKDLYDELCKFYEVFMGPLPWRDEFRRTLEETVTKDDLAVFFLVPLTGNAPVSKLQRKAKMPAPELQARLERLATEGLIMLYAQAGETVCERGNPAYMTEQQVRKPEETARRAFYARFFNGILNGDVSIAIPTKTPYYRVLPIESTVSASSERRVIPVDVHVPDPRAVLPIDIVSEMVRRDAQSIAVADCYCRLTKRLVGEGCGHALQTCLVFNKVAEALVDYGTARRIDYDEAMRIIWEAEEAGLVHNVDNCEGEIGSVCNCCPCCSILLRSWHRGITNADSPSRYRVDYDRSLCDACAACLARCPADARSLVDASVVIDETLCLGCGLCVTACKQGANHMVLRERQVPLARTGEDLYRKIGREAVVGLAVQKIAGWVRRS